MLRRNRHTPKIQLHILPKNKKKNLRFLQINSLISCKNNWSQFLVLVFPTFFLIFIIDCFLVSDWEILTLIDTLPDSILAISWLKQLWPLWPLIVPALTVMWYPLIPIRWPVSFNVVAENVAQGILNVDSIFIPWKLTLSHNSL